MTSQQDQSRPPPVGEGFNTPRTDETTNTWLTPLSLIQSLGVFDLDPCCPPVMPWRTAEHMNLWGDRRRLWLSLDWSHYGRIWLNPPYGEHTFKWMRKFAEHKRGIALIFARTDTKGFHDHVFSTTRAIYFLRGRVKFHREDGSCPKNGPAAPSCLVAHTEEDVAAIAASGLAGSMMIPGNCQPLIPMLEQTANDGDCP
jgi:DNA N-6-adenine-methyltransferase (Dam)